jgi:hypothetical protein
MPSLENRIAALEVETSHAETLTIIRRFVSPGQPLSELRGLQDNDGNEWLRLPGETEQGLIDRASLQAWRNPWGVTCLIERPCHRYPNQPAS